MKLKVATALIAVATALSLTGTAPAWWSYVPPTSSQEQGKTNQAKTEEKAAKALASYTRG